MNINSIKRGVKKAIKVANLKVDIRRNETIDDGAGGTIIIENGKVVHTIEALVDNSSSAQLKKYVVQGGVVQYSNSPTLLFVAEEGLDVRKDDYFIIGKHKYLILDVVDVLELGIYYQCPLEVTVCDTN